MWKNTTLVGISTSQIFPLLYNGRSPIAPLAFRNFQESSKLVSVSFHEGFPVLPYWVLTEWSGIFQCYEFLQAIQKPLCSISTQNIRMKMVQISLINFQVISSIPFTTISNIFDTLQNKLLLPCYHNRIKLITTTSPPGGPHNFAVRQRQGWSGRGAGNSLGESFLTLTSFWILHSLVIILCYFLSFFDRQSKIYCIKRTSCSWWWTLYLKRIQVTQEEIWTKGRKSEMEVHYVKPQILTHWNKVPTSIGFKRSTDLTISSKVWLLYSHQINHIKQAGTIFQIFPFSLTNRMQLR